MELTVDIAVIGAGAAGLPAAWEAANSGASVAIFERESSYGGSCNGGNGVFAVESKMMDLMQLTYTKKEIFDYWMEFTHYSVDGEIVSAYINKSADTVEWLQQKGVIFDGVVSYFKGAYFVWHMRSHQSPTVSDAIMAHMPSDVQMYYNVSVLKLLEKDGRITGFIGITDSGDTVTVHARAVILATGGMARRRDLVYELTGVQIGVDLDVLGDKTQPGDEANIPCAYELANAVGCKTSRVLVDQYAAMPAPYFGPGGTPLALGAFRQPHNIFINRLGRRFINETEYRNGAFTANAIARQPGGTAFMIFGTAVKQHYDRNGWTYNISNPPVFDEPDLEGYFPKAAAEGYPYLLKAGSLREVAEYYGIDEEQLIRTVGEYNANARLGLDPVFFKDCRYLMPIEGPNYYVAQFKRGSYGVLGGIEINCNGEILGKDDMPIPGLYSVGNDANNIYGYSYPFALSGNTSSFAINMGRIAGQHAARAVRQEG